MLYLIASPIGNLGDLTYRAVEVLKQCEYVLCENTRRSRTLLKRYEVDVPLVSFHKFNEKAREEGVLADLKEGKDIGMLSDAGTPGISDPGARLVDACQEEKIEYTSIPGASSLSMAMSLAGSAATRSQFVGFLPKKSKQIIATLSDALAYPGATFFFESPHRILKTLEILHSLEEERQVMIFRELTKVHEEVIGGSPKELIERFSRGTPKGEFVVMVKQGVITHSYDHLTLHDHVEQLEEELGFSRKEAIKAVAELRNMPKRTVYNTFHERDHE